MPKPELPIKLAYLITVSRNHVVPAQLLISTLLAKTIAPIYVVGNLEAKDRRFFLNRDQIIYIDEDDIDLSNRAPIMRRQVKHREWGWYKQMFIRLCIDRFIPAEQVVILDSEVFVFDNWDESRFYTENANPKCFYWIPRHRKPPWDYAMYQGAAYLYQSVPGMSNVTQYAMSNGFRRHISGVVLFSTRNIAYIWNYLEQHTSLHDHMDHLFHEMSLLAFSDHDFYGIAMDYGICNHVVKTELSHELLGWYDNHNDPEFDIFRNQNPMWSMCQRHENFPVPKRYVAYIDYISHFLDRRYQLEIPIAQMQSDIQSLMTKPTEIVQPVYGCPQIPSAHTKQWEERLLHVTDVYRAMEKHLGRPLRVMEIGCGNGYLSFHLAELGAIVTATEHRRENIELVDALIDQYPSFSLNVLVATPETALQLDVLPTCDLIIGINLVDDLIEKHGSQAVTKALAELAKIAPALILQVRRISTNGKSSAPADERQYFAGSHFLHELTVLQEGQHSHTHAIYFASNTLWYLSGQIEAFHSWRAFSHDLVKDAYLDTRRYYFSDHLIAKKFWCEKKPGSINRDQIENEARILSEPLPLMQDVPKILTYGTNHREAWLVRELLPGTCLSDVRRSGKMFDPFQVFDDVLAQLEQLEAKGYYHSDIRTWNVLVTVEGRSMLIDHGAIGTSTKDCYDERDVYYMFRVFVWCLLTGKPDFHQPQRAPIITGESFPNPYRIWAKEVFDAPEVCRSFRHIREKMRNLTTYSLSTMR